jgi:cell division septation protein DedD
VAVAPPASPAAAAPAGTAAPADGFQIFVAAFRTEQRAEEVADEVRVGGGLPVMTRLDSTGRWYSIVAGPYKTAEEARTAQTRLERLGFTGTRVTPTGPDPR